MVKLLTYASVALYALGQVVEGATISTNRSTVTHTRTGANGSTYTHSHTQTKSQSFSKTHTPTTRSKTTHTPSTRTPTHTPVTHTTTKTETTTATPIKPTSKKTKTTLSTTTKSTSTSTSSSTSSSTSTSTKTTSTSKATPTNPYTPGSCEYHEFFYPTYTDSDAVTYRLDCGQQILGVPVSALPASSFGECFDLCDHAFLCSAFTYEVGVCSFFGLSVTLVPNPLADSAVRG